MRSSMGGTWVTGSDNPVPRLSQTTSRRCQAELLGHRAVHRRRVVVEIDIADPAGDQHNRDVAVAHLPIGEPDVPVSRVFDASDTHIAKCVMIAALRPDFYSAPSSSSPASNASRVCWAAAICRAVKPIPSAAAPTTTAIPATHSSE